MCNIFLVNVLQAGRVGGRVLHYLFRNHINFTRGSVLKNVVFIMILLYSPRGSTPYCFSSASDIIIIMLKWCLPSLDITCRNLYINLACLSVCLSVRLYPINVKTAEPIGPKFFVGHHVSPGKVYE